MKDGLEMRMFHDLLTHLSCTMVFTLRKDRISAMSSSGRNVGGGALGRNVGGVSLNYPYANFGGSVCLKKKNIRSS